MHEKKIDANIYCKTHNLYLCNDCWKIHGDKDFLSQKMEEIEKINKDKDESKEDNIIKIFFADNHGKNLSFRISNKTPLNEALKIFANKMYIPKILLMNLYLYSMKKHWIINLKILWMN